METVDIHRLKVGEVNLGVRVLSCIEIDLEECSGG